MVYNHVIIYVYKHYQKESLNFYYNKIDFFEGPNQVTFNNIDFYLNNFDKKFLDKFNAFSISDLDNLIKELSYFNVTSLNRKMKFLLYFKKNQRRIK